MNNTCPKCRKPIKLAAIEPHPISGDLAVHKFECGACGPVLTKILLRKRNKSSPGLAAWSIGNFVD
jgi:ssDNA-binding Zn-finger/Zn-ribbon topoisomerase 1